MRGQLNPLTKNQLDTQQIALAVYCLIVLGKRFWLGDLNGVFFLVADALCFVILPVTLVASLSLPIRLPHSIDKGRTEYTRHHLGKILFFSTLCIFVLYASRMIGMHSGVVITNAWPDLLPPRIDYSMNIPKHGIIQWLSLLYFCITPAIVEEYFFRGIVRLQLQRLSSSGLVFVFLSALLFGLIHWGGGLFSVINTTIIGLAAAALYLWIRNLLPLMIGHFFIDIIAFWPA